ncbi:MAG: hypothetical protein F4139_02590 [Gemmatimonadetes bacterium]|nr:hypothetical protein [Gemmatimonadota bacterium]MYH51819.1 hypothetical protein [Gemmatimonadota bacterium]
MERYTNPFRQQFTGGWLLLLTLAGCGGAPVHGTPDTPLAGPDRGLDPVRVVAEFLGAANRRDHGAMASRFGTGDGPIGETGSAVGCAFRRVGSWIGLGERCLSRPEVELRMDLIAGVLAHESYRIRSADGVVGRGRPAARVEVEVVTEGRTVVVPFVVIRADNGRWLVEEVGLRRMVG